jgi:quinol monooxygenase YgiN
MPKVILQGYIEVSDADLDLVQSELPHHIDLTRHEAGCLASVLSGIKNVATGSMFMKCL